MKTTKYLKTIVLTLCIIIANCSKDDPIPPITEIGLDKTELTLNVQDTDQLSVTTEINNKLITWTSDAPEVVSIDENGTITALRGGTATITAQVDDVQTTCTITVNPDIYLLARGFDTSIIIKNGEIIKQIPEPVKDFFVTEKGVYVLTEHRVFLNNEIVLDFSISISEYKLNAIYVADEDVYVCGNTIAFPETVATVWKNGIQKTLSNTNSSAENIVVSNGEVYVFGTEEPNGNVEEINYVVWKNELPITNIPIFDNGFSNEIEINPNSLFVGESDVYFGGTSRNSEANESRGTIWKNGVEISLSNSEATGVNSIFVEDGDVYAIGSQYVGVDDEITVKAVFWKNGTINNVSLDSNIELGNDMAIYGDDVYIIVTKYDSSTRIFSIKLFKNGQEIVLATGLDLDTESNEDMIKVFFY